MSRWRGRAVPVPLLALLLSACPSSAPLGDDDDSAADNGPVRAEWPPPPTLGGDRPAAVVVPEAYDGFEPMPLVLLLGGFWNLSSDLDAWIGVSDQVDAHGFVLLMPDGTLDPDGAPFWNATDTCCDDYGSGVDDAGYLRALIEEATERLAVDASRVVMVGHSNGGFMAYRMACEPDSPVTGLVSIAGSGWLDPADCHATHPVAVLQVHGGLDDVMPFDGDAWAPGALEMLERWAERDGCVGELTEDPSPLELVDDGLDGETKVSRYGGCERPVELWWLDGSDHYPEFRPEFADLALRWAL
jgi:polyhydroxybutyrate depolymerase